MVEEMGLDGGAEQNPEAPRRRRGAPAVPESRVVGVLAARSRGLTVLEIARELGITPGQVNYITLREDERLKGAPGSRERIIARLFSIFDLQLKQMEKRMDDGNFEEAALLGSMVQTLGRLIDIENGRKAPAQQKKSTREMLALREQIARRIDELNGH